MPNGAWAYPGTAIISGTGKATDFKFSTHILSIDRNKSPLQISGKVAVGVLGDYWKFSGHPYWGAYRAHRAVIFVAAQLSCYTNNIQINKQNRWSTVDKCSHDRELSCIVMQRRKKHSQIIRQKINYKCRTYGKQANDGALGFLKRWRLSQPKQEQEKMRSDTRSVN